MVKLIVSILILAVVVLGAVLLVKDDPGFVLIKYADFSLETSLAFSIVALVVAVIVIHFVFRLIRGIWRLPTAFKSNSSNRQLIRSRKLLNQGLIDLTEGRFNQAERNLVRLVEHSETPLIHYLAAARAAQLQGKYDERDGYIKAAHDAQPEAEIAIGVTQAELQLAHRQNEQSLATLNHLRTMAPRHDYILMLLARVYYALDDWTSLVEVLPEVSKKKLIPEKRLSTMERNAYQGLLDFSASTDGSTALEQAWNKIPRTNQADPSLLLHYISLINQQGGQVASVEALVLKSLEQQWDDRVIQAYGELNSSDTDTQLKRAEKWLTDYAQNENLLLALGRICMRARLWGKAQGYLEASIGIKAMPASCLALAELFGEHLKESSKASRYYKMGLELSLKNA